MKRIVVFFLVICLGLSLLACGKGAGVKEDQGGMTWQEQYDLGIRLLNEGRYEDAVLAFTAALQIEPKCAQAYIGRADAYVAWVESVMDGLDSPLKEGQSVNDILVPVSTGEKTIGDLIQYANDDYKKAEELLPADESIREPDESTGELGETWEDSNEVQESVDSTQTESNPDMQPESQKRPVLYKITYYEGQEHRGSKVGFEYDESGNVVKEIWYNDNGAVYNIRKYAYDENGVEFGGQYLNKDGTVKSSWESLYDANGHKLYDGKSEGTILITDDRGYVIEVKSIASNGEEIIRGRYTYDTFGNMSGYFHTFDGDVPIYGNLFYYDSDNRLSVHKTGAGDMSGVWKEMHYTYDAAGNIASIETRFGNEVISQEIYSYNVDGEILRRDHQYVDGFYSYVEYTYNDRGELIREYHSPARGAYDIDPAYWTDFFYE